jgi:hypothetical protein
VNLFRLKSLGSSRVGLGVRLIASRKVVPLPPSPLPGKLYATIDGAAWIWNIATATFPEASEFDRPGRWASSSRQA